MAVKVRNPSLTALQIAALSAQTVGPYAPFSTLQPLFCKFHHHKLLFDTFSTGLLKEIHLLLFHQLMFVMQHPQQNWSRDSKQAYALLRQH